MQDWLDSTFDVYMTNALHAATAVTPQQKQASWEKVRERAAAQAMLPPLSPVCEASAAVPSSTLVDTCLRLLRTTSALLLDDASYERALRHRRDTFYLGDLLHGSHRHMVFGLVA